MTTTDATATDSFGNVGTDATLDELRVDSAPLTAVIMRTGNEVNNNNVVNFSVTFSKNVGSTFTAADVTTTGTVATTAAVSGSGSAYTVTLTTADPNADGTVGFSIGTAVQDSVGNSLTGSPTAPLYTLDNAPPLVIK